MISLMSSLLFLLLFSGATEAALSAADLDSAFTSAQKTLNGFKSTEDSAFTSGYFLKDQGASARHQYSTHGTANRSFQDPAFLFCSATQSLVTSGKVQKNEVTSLRTLNLASSPQASEAQQACTSTLSGVTTTCSNQNQYSFDGSCNNVNRPILGRTNTCHRRMFPAAYDDGIDAPRRRSVNGGELPNERVISVRALTNILNSVRDDPTFSHYRMSFGQFIAHDISLTPTTTIGPNNALPDCCNPSNTMSQCYRINIPSNDSFYRGQTCINFVRSTPCPTCTLGPREQQNAVTTFIDLSHIYGLTDQANIDLRTRSGGFLQGQVDISQNQNSYAPLLMPASTNLNDGCSTANNRCFRGGDPLRVNQQIGISALSTQWVRYHNIICSHINDYLSRTNRRWDDERVFQLARRIAQAHMQLIVFREWLPTIIGTELMRRRNLLFAGAQTRYDASRDPTLWAEFAVGAFRFGHSIIQNRFDLVDNQGAAFGSVPTRDIFSSIPRYNNLNDLTIEKVINGLHNQPGKEISFSFAEGVTNNVYRSINQTMGMDLPALNIHRGRDHAVSPYYIIAEQFINEYFSGQNTFRNWRSIQPYWRDECNRVLPQVYGDLRDVDLYVGGLCELSVDEGTVGPTFASIIAYQFSDLLYADRFFVSHATSFSTRQYAELLRTGFNYFVDCATFVGSDNYVAENPFIHYNDYDNLVSCSSLNEINIGLFIDGSN